MDRIEINGVWYVKEAIKEHIELDPTHYEGYVVENSDFCFEATRIFKDDGTLYDDNCSIECTDKRLENREDWKVEHWDNNHWMLGVLNNSPDAWKELPDMGGKANMNFLLAFLQYLTDKGWL